MAYLLDTQVLIDAYHRPDSLPEQVRKIVLSREERCGVSSMSLVEIGVKNNLGNERRRLDFSVADQKEAIADLVLTVLPFKETHAYALATLPAFHSDPFDRMIISVALVENMTLVGKDEKLNLYRRTGLKTLWE